MLQGSTLLDKLAIAEGDLKPFSVLLTTNLLAKFSADDANAFASLVLQARLKLVGDYALVVRSADMFARIYLGGLFDKIGFPFNIPEDKLRNLILNKPNKIVDFFKDPNPEIIKILLPFYHDYVNSDSTTPREKKAENFMGKISFTYVETDIGLRLSKGDPNVQRQLSTTLKSLKSSYFKSYEEALEKNFKSYQPPVITAKAQETLKAEFQSCEKIYRRQIIPLREKLKQIDWAKYIGYLSHGSKYIKKIQSLIEQVKLLERELDNGSYKTIVPQFEALTAQYQFLCRVIELTQIWEILAEKFANTERGKEYDLMCSQIDNYYSELEKSLAQASNKQLVKAAAEKLSEFLKEPVNKTVAQLTPLHRLAEHLTETTDDKAKIRVSTLINRLIKEGADITATTTEFKLYRGTRMTANELLAKHNCPAPTLWEQANNLKKNISTLIFSPGYHREGTEKDDKARRMSLPSPRSSPERKRSNSTLVEDKLDLAESPRAATRRQTTSDVVQTESSKKRKTITVQ